MLGSVEEKRIIELGAGIGRFTGSLAATARNVTAVDFMANSIEENRRINGHRWTIFQFITTVKTCYRQAGCATCSTLIILALPCTSACDQYATAVVSPRSCSLLLL